MRLTHSSLLLLLRMDESWTETLHLLIIDHSEKKRKSSDFESNGESLFSLRSSIHRDFTLIQSLDEDDADLIALRNAALRTLPFHKRHRHDRDDRCENKTSATNHGDIDERFPSEQDLLIVDCPSDVDEEKPKEENRPVSATVKLNPNEFDLRQIIKKRRIEHEEEHSSSSFNERKVRSVANEKLYSRSSKKNSRRD